MYHRTEPAQIVHSQEELEALGDDWYASPADIPPAAAPEQATLDISAAAPVVDPDDKRKRK
jgi:hypothetical protein